MRLARRLGLELVHKSEFFCFVRVDSIAKQDDMDIDDTDNENLVIHNDEVGGGNTGAR